MPAKKPSSSLDGRRHVDLRSFYSYVNEEEVEDFLERKPHMAKVLSDFLEFLKKEYGVTKSRIKHIEDDYYDYDALDVIPSFRTKDRKELNAMEDEIFRAFLCSLDLPFSESMVVTVRASDHD